MIKESSPASILTGNVLDDIRNGFKRGEKGINTGANIGQQISNLNDKIGDFGQKLGEFNQHLSTLSTIESNLRTVKNGFSRNLSTIDWDSLQRIVPRLSTILNEIHKVLGFLMDLPLIIYDILKSLLMLLVKGFSSSIVALVCIIIIIVLILIASVV